jgi:enoyl-CoA hydratase
MPSDDLVIYESVDDVAVITLNRPDLNILNAELGEALRQAWLRFNDSDDRVAILTGAGDKAFTAGADLDDLPEMWRLSPGIGVEVEKPIIAAVNGWCVGGGVVLVQFCDLCVASDRARFRYPEAKVGYSGGMIASIVARMPHKVAMELILLGEDMSAQRAYDVGFVNRVVPAADLMDAAMGYAETLKANAPMVMALMKRFTAQVIPKGPAELSGVARRDTDVWIAESEDFEEGVTAFNEKRTPKFVGR